MLSFIRILLSSLIAYFLGRVIYCSFCNSSEKQSLIAKSHSFFIGLVFSSMCFWFYTIISNGQNTWYPIFEISLIVIFYLNIRKKHIKSFGIFKFNYFPLVYKKDYLFFNLSTIIIFSFITILCLINCSRYPDGAWDAVAMWNCKAIFLACGNESWSGMFSDDLSYTHSDYPLFLSCIIARTYIYVGKNNSIIPLLFSYLFCISCFILPFLYLNKLKNKYYALFAVCLLSLSPNIINEGSKQYADIPLSVFFLISIYEIIIWDYNTKKRLYKLPWLCILFSSSCFWIKNEGIPWFILYSLLLYYFNKFSFSSVKVFYGIIPSFLSRISIKFFTNTSIDFPVPLSSSLSNFFNLEYYNFIGIYICYYIKANIFIVLIPVFLLSGFIDKKYSKYKVILILITLMYFNYVLIYFFISDRLQLHLANSFPRIATHFLPSLVFLGCLIYKNKQSKPIKANEITEKEKVLF